MAPSESSSRRNRTHGGSNNKLWLGLVGLSLFLCLANVVYHELHLKQHSMVDSHALHLQESQKNLIVENDIPATVEKPIENKTVKAKKQPQISVIDEAGNDKHVEEDEEDQHYIAGLSCEKYGGLSDEAAQNMVYWDDIPSDSKYISPFFEAGNEKYMTFEPDGGGWNNIRMAMETVIVMAHAMGRTLVLPPEKRMYLIGKGDNKQKFKFTFNDFFHLDTIHLEHDGFNMITMEEYLVREAMTGKLVNTTSGLVAYPPNNRTKWDGEDLKPLWEYLRETTDVRNWKPGNCIAAFPASRDPEDTQRLRDAFQTAMDDDKRKKSLRVPVPVDASVSDRIRELRGWHRSQLCLYDEKMQASHTVHFMCYHKQRARLLTHFYSFLFFEDWKQELWAKRFVRDHIRYRDELMCAAGKIVDAVRMRAKSKNPASNPNGLYDSLHIRRGDFQFKETRLEADKLFEITKEKLQPGATVFIATDERNKGFFKPFRGEYDVVFLDDFKHLIPDMNTNYFGMLDQLIASKGRVFYGTYFSTLSGYIMRMRGYSGVKNRVEGYQNGGLKDSYYIWPKKKQLEMSEYVPVMGGQWQREYPVSWHGIDKGIESLHEQ
uniref:O-fucosyltransferase family protein n=1 Tax=Leptocylindrus danicus TaxID=163516 RepID=A0A7S2L6Y3_9STRA|mmetsp:Transcript_32771/g.47431  ORF Transcript_32771/g.47431 Transcript_32771/m.47431 type:complete len:603 (-) Transcript_32771:33-1841(-)